MKLTMDIHSHSSDFMEKRKTSFKINNHNNQFKNLFRFVYDLF